MHFTLCLFFTIIVIVYGYIDIKCSSDHPCDNVHCDSPPKCREDQVLGPEDLCGCCQQCVTLLSNYQLI